MLGLSLASVASFSRSSGANEFAAFVFNDSTKLVCSGVCTAFPRGADRLRVELWGVSAFKISSANVGSSACTELVGSAIAAARVNKVTVSVDLPRFTNMLLPLRIEYAFLI